MGAPLTSHGERSNAPSHVAAHETARSRRPSAPRAALIAFLLLASALGCGGAVVAAPSEPPLYRGALTDFVPAAGLRWLVAGSPRALARASVLAPLRERWLT